jgi:hypothetical protein
VAAVVTGVELSSHDVGVDMSLDPYLGFDVEINIYGGLDGDTSLLIENAKKAAEKLRQEYGVEVFVSPNIVNWDVVSINFTPYNLPILVVNGIQIAEGRVLSADEIVDVVLEVLDKKSRDTPLTINGKSDDLVQIAACTW